MISHSARLLAVAAIVVPVALVAGCSDSPDPAPAPSATVAQTTPAPSPSAASSSGLDEADEAAILAAFDKYKAATLTAYTKPDADPALWRDFGDEVFIATESKAVQDYIDQGITFTGAPEYHDVTVTETEDGSAVITMCIDESKWIGTLNGEPLPPRPDDVHPMTMSASTATGEWRLGPGPAVPAGLTC